MSPPVLAAPLQGKPLILYIATQEQSVGALLARENDEGKENSLYYLSRRMPPNELKYMPIEKLCLTVVFAIQKLKYYFHAHTINLISKANLIKYIMSKPVLPDRLARQLTGEYSVRKMELIPYHGYAEKLLQSEIIRGGIVEVSLRCKSSPGNERSSFKSMRRTPVRSQTSLSDQKNGVLLTYHGKRLHGICTILPAMPIPRSFHTSAARAIASYNSFVAIRRMGIRHGGAHAQVTGRACLHARRH
ncbi:hypothetical protein LIER_09385 [Lithospermum erythrorhizon]|uniref:Reverse transcriptase RNase H-like domain-containing protein n=1 Tax=Lithospermum erythrorhizon TaxID=34254 RepID=A0AAV3PIC8_LITER